jgi:diguanylate cyclase (GGDEF)-like protein
MTDLGENIARLLGSSAENLDLLQKMAEQRLAASEQFRRGSAEIDCRKQCSDMAILVVDDSVHIRTQVKAFLGADGYANLRFADTAPAALRELGIGESDGMETDLVLMDVNMPELDGVQACRHIKEHLHLKDVPVIMVTADKSPEQLQAAFDAGATDYITKPLNRLELGARVHSALRLKREMDMRKTREAELVHLTHALEECNGKLNEMVSLLHRLSITDGLTELSNRRHFDEMLQFEWNRTLRDGRPISLLLLDIDYFKIYNDTYGHQAGDAVLQQVAKTMRLSLCRASDMPTRYGGEEFAVVLPDCDLQSALNVADLLRRRVLELAIPHSGSRVSPWITLSIGAASAIARQKDRQETLLAAADQALYRAKAQGRNRIEAAAAPQTGGNGQPSASPNRKDGD